MDLKFKPTVTSVTVYLQQARVTVQASLSLTTGRHRLIMGDLPLSMDTNSLRAGGYGAARIRLFGVDVKPEHYAQTPADNVRAVEERIEQLEDELQAASDEQDILDAQSRYLEGLRGASEQYARGLAMGRTNVETQGDIGRFFREQDQELRAARRELDKQRRELNRSLDKARRELKQLTSTRPPQRYQAIVELEALSDGDFTAELTYNVKQAAWQPIYDVRLGEDEGGSHLEIDSIAQITQSSGQDWRDIDLQVSTAQTSLNRRVPKLKPWFVDVYAPPVPRAAAVQMQAGARRQQAVLMDAPAVAEEPAEAKAAMAKVSTEESGATVTYRIAGKGDVPSDGSPHKMALFQTRLPAKIDYITVPKHTDAVFRRTKGNNEGQSPLLAGTVNLFVGQRFIGVSHLDYVAVGDELEMLLGVEERITVERKLGRRDVDKTRLRDKRQIQYGYEIEIKNLLPKAVNIELHDHVPLARHEEIAVKLLKSSPEPTERTDMNLLEWQLTLPAGASTEVSYEYQVEHPRSMRVTGLVE